MCDRCDDYHKNHVAFGLRYGELMTAPFPYSPPCRVTAGEFTVEDMALPVEEQEIKHANESEAK